MGAMLCPDSTRQAYFPFYKFRHQYHPKSVLVSEFSLRIDGIDFRRSIVAIFMEVTSAGKTAESDQKVLINLDAVCRVEDYGANNVMLYFASFYPGDDGKMQVRGTRQEFYENWRKAQVNYLAK